MITRVPHYLPPMHRVWIVCRCGHEGWGQTAADVLRLDRATLLRRARCTACQTRGAVEMRLVWDAGANAMLGAGTGREGWDE